MNRQFFILQLILMCSTAAAQPFVTGAPAVMNTNLGMDLHAGVRLGKVYASAGYTAVIHPGQPALFQGRAGYVINDRFVIFSGATHVLHSVDYKSRNYWTWTAGGQYHFAYYERTTFFINASYTPGYPVIGAGMSYNLYRW
jgi:hypothetical protein